MNTLFETGQDGGTAGPAGAPSALIAFGASNAAALRQSGINGHCTGHQAY